MELKDVRGGLCGQEKDVEEPTSFQEASTCLENQAKTSWEFLERYFKGKTTNIIPKFFPRYITLAKKNGFSINFHDVSHDFQ